MRYISKVTLIAIVEQNVVNAGRQPSRKSSARPADLKKENIFTKFEKSLFFRTLNL